MPGPEYLIHLLPGLSFIMDTDFLLGPIYKINAVA